MEIQKTIVNETTQVKRISTLWACAIMFLLSYFGRIHMCTLCKSQKGPAGGGGRGESTGRQRRAFSLRSSTGELFKKPSFSTPFSEIQLAETSGACSGETGNARYHRSRSTDRDVYCDFRDTCCLSPFDWQHRRLSALSVSLFPRPSNGGLQPPLANATDAEPISFGRTRAAFRTTNPECIARACVFTFFFFFFFLARFCWFYEVGIAWLRLATRTQLWLFAIRCTRLMSKVPTQTRTETVMRPGLNLLIAGGGAKAFCLLVRQWTLHTDLCLNPHHEASLARVADLWADRTGLETHFKPVDGGQSALWVHDLLTRLAIPDKAGRIRESELSLPLTLPLFHTHLSFISRFFASCVSPTQTPNVLLCPSPLCFSLFLLKWDLFIPLSCPVLLSCSHSDST